MSSSSEPSGWSAGFQHLVAAARAGSPDAAGRLLESCRLYLLTIANEEMPSRVRPDIAASDVVQDTFLEAQRDFAAFAGQSERELRGWLRRMLLHNLMDIARRHERMAGRGAAHPAQGASPENEETVLRIVSHDPTPSACAIARERDVQLAQSLQRLRPDYRIVIQLRYQEGLTFDEIAQRMDRSVDAVRKLWLRGIRHLQQLLEEQKL